jgi:hypothetical protein
MLNLLEKLLVNNAARGIRKSVALVVESSDCFGRLGG